MSQPGSARSARPSPLRILILAVFLDLLGFGLVLPVLPAYALQLGASKIDNGLLFAVFALVQMLMMPVWGRLSDRIGRRPVLGISMAGMAAGHLVCALAPSLAVLFLGRIVAGFFSSTIAVSRAYVADVTPPDERARGLGLLGAAFGLGFVFGPALGGIVSEPDTMRRLLGQDLATTLGDSARAIPFVVATGLSLAALAVTRIRLPESRASADRSLDGRTANPLAMLAALGRPRVGAYLGIFFLATIAWAGMEANLIYLLMDRFAYGDRDRGLVVAFMGLVMVIAMAGLIRPLTRRYGERALVFAAALVFALGLVGLPYAPGLGGLLLACFAIGIGNGIGQPAVLSVISRLSLAAEQGAVLGLAQSLAGLGRMVGPAAGGALYETAWGYAGPMVLAAVVMVVTAAVAFTAWRRSDPVLEAPIA